MRARRPGTAIVVVYMHGHDGDVREVLRAGVAGYVVRTAAPRDLLKAVRAAATGRRYVVLDVPPSWTLRPSRPNDAPAELTPRERDVRLLLVRGHSNHDTATQLGIRLRTVETHRTNLMRRLGLHSQADLVRHAAEEGILGRGESVARSQLKERSSL